MLRCLAAPAAASALRAGGGARAASTAAPAAPAANSGRLWKITLRRSPIGLHPKIRENARALGLTRCGHVVYRQVSDTIAGKIIKVKEIVKLELVGRVEPIKKPAPAGYEVIGRLNPQIAPGSKAAKPLLPLRKRSQPSQ
ncbi:39S ribosomal protein L33, mitochondrial [Coemansia javaensis]|uniref:Large ribosomal subunit protein uL30m n=1 Tax=Coemansia javaensis TaxID=2761396 RepID=A0A9W8H8E1_9FUNG|nr:39S ribosomal protein L33, mitochondrial [Coemansia javaensis]